MHQSLATVHTVLKEWIDRLAACNKRCINILLNKRSRSSLSPDPKIVFSFRLLSAGYSRLYFVYTTPSHGECAPGMDITRPLWCLMSYRWNACVSAAQCDDGAKHIGANDLFIFKIKSWKKHKYALDATFNVQFHLWLSARIWSSHSSAI